MIEPGEGHRARPPSHSAGWAPGQSHGRHGGRPSKAEADPPRRGLGHGSHRLARLIGDWGALDHRFDAALHELLAELLEVAGGLGEAKVLLDTAAHRFAEALAIGRLADDLVHALNVGAGVAP